MNLEQVLALAQTGALILTMAVAIGTLRGRGDEKTVACASLMVK